MDKRIALAFRPELHTPSQIVEYAKAVDTIGSVSHIFIPDIPGGLESIEISAAALALTKNLKVGSGIIRLLEHDNRLLQRRLETLQSISENRFILGVGTGRAGTNPKETIVRMLSQLDQLRASFGNASRLGVAIPETFVAALKKGIAKRAAGHCDGLLLNFCSPDYAKSVVDSVNGVRSRPTFACYLKIFYSKKLVVANRLLIDEFVKYDSIDSYHEMFVRDGIAQAIMESRRGLESAESVIPESLLRISLVNPGPDELKEYANNFRKVGIDLPCLYPYFVKEESHEYKMSIISEIARSL
ncbi:MAG: LLM class flavin-dependent oxidoreductase [Nitrososphaerales archaeon]